MKITLLSLALAASAAYGQQTTILGQSGIVAQLADGDGWQTLISLNNIDAVPAQYKLSFFDDTGAPMLMQTSLGTGTVLYSAIAAHGSVTIATPGTQGGLTQGWAKVETIFPVLGGNTIAPGATLAGTVLFLRPPTVPRATEASEPLDFSQKTQWVLPFDHTNGYTSGVALVNASASQDISITLTFFDNSGAQLYQDTFALPRGQHKAITLTQNYPAVIGRLGTLRVVANGAINVLGLHISPAGVITSTSPTSW